MKQIFLFLLLLFILTNYIKAVSYFVEGHVKSDDPSLVANIPVVLIPIFLKEDNTLGLLPPIMKSKTDEKGFYKFENIPEKKINAYQIGILTTDQQRLSSKPFFFSAENTTQIVDIEVPRQIQNLDDLKIHTNSLIIYPILQEKAFWFFGDQDKTRIKGLLIEEIISIENPTENILNGVKSPLYKRLPKGATNLQPYQFSSTPPEFNIAPMNEGVHFFFRIPKGLFQIAYRYEILFEEYSNTLTLNTFLLKGTKQFDLLTPVDRLEVRIQGKNLPNENTSASNQFTKKTFSVKQNETQLQIIIENFPSGTLRLYIFTFILLILLMTALVFFLIRSKK